MPEQRVPESSNPDRRRRYARAPLPAPLVSLTPVRAQILRYLAELRFLSLPQIARLCCPAERRDLAEKSARRQMRTLFDAGLVDVLPISRAALAPLGTPNDASLLYGSAPNVYAPTARALKLLHRASLIGDDMLRRPPPAYGPRNSLFLAHELAVRDVRVWLEECARSGGNEVERWQDGEDAAIGLGQGSFSVRPDAWFAYRMGEVVLVGLVEVDRGTERGDRRWSKKLDCYGVLFANRTALCTGTGYVNARVLLLAPTPARSNTLAAFILEQAQVRGLPADLPERFWLAEHDALFQTCLTAPIWHRPGSNEVWALVSEQTLWPVSS